MSKKIYAVSVNIATIACAVAGLFHAVVWAWNITAFVMWLSTVALTLCMFNEKSKLELRRKGRNIPKWFSIATDLVLALLFAATGHFGYAAMSAWQIGCEAAIFEGEK